MSPTYKFWDMQKSIPLHCINMCSAIWIELGIVFWYVYIYNDPYDDSYEYAYDDAKDGAYEDSFDDA